MLRRSSKAASQKPVLEQADPWTVRREKKGMSTYSPKAHEALLELQYEAEGIELMLATGLAIRHSGILQNRFHLLSGAHESREVQITGLVPDCCFRFRIGKAFAVSRALDPHVPSINFREALDRDGQLSDKIWEATQIPQVQTKARDLIGFYTEPSLPLRSLVCELAEWSPLLEQFSYKYAARLVALLNALRPQILLGTETENCSRISRYWISSLIAGRAILFASNAETSSWHAEMAGSIKQSDWTPSLPLTRERSLWLACCAAKSAAKFGSSVVDRYFDVLSGSKDFLVSFDSLFGLISIGLAHPNEAKAIAGDLERLARRGELKGLANLAVAEALKHLTRCGSASSGEDRKRNPVRFATAQTLSADPALLEGRKFSGFEILPSIIEANGADLFPETEEERKPLVLDAYEAERIFRRAWAPAADPALVLH